MSSRAASARKRLNQGEEKKEKKPASRGFFSRSKESAPERPVIDPSPVPFLVPQDSTQVYIGRDGEPHMPNHRSNQTKIPSSAFANPAETPDAYANPRTSMPKQATPIASSSRGLESGYPSPPRETYLPSQTLRVGAPGRGTRTIGYQDEGPSYIEASYQPPPPIHATYQPPPPVSAGRNGRPLPTVPEKGSYSSPVDQDSPAYSTPPTFPPPLPGHLASPATSPRQSSARYSSTTVDSIRSQSPTPSYHSSQPSFPFASTSRPTLQVAIHDRPPGQIDSIYGYPSPPSPSPLRQPHTMTRTQQPHQMNGKASLLIEVENRIQNGGVRSTDPLPPPSPVTVRFQEAAFPRQPATPSLSDSSTSGKSTKSNEPKPAFVYPGSRSVAKPKVPKKKNNPVITVNGKSRLSDATGSSGSSNHDFSSPVSPDNGLYTPVSPPKNGGLFPIISTPNKRHSGSSSGYSDSSSDSSHARRGKPVGFSSAATPTPGADKLDTPTAYVFPTSRSRAHPKKKTGPNTKAAAAGGNGKGERKRFMGILLSKKKSRDTGNQASGYSDGVALANSDSHPNVPGPEFVVGSSNTSDATLAYAESQAATQQDVREKAMKIKSRIGNYPLDPYDSVLLDNDRHTGELLSRLNPTGSPTFHDYGNAPPTSVLDLGCGQGHWVVDAAIAWKGYGTKVTGYDMVDISRGLFPWAAEQGVVENIRFVRGNFLKQRLPFNDESFDLVRMSCLSLCVTADSWIFVLQEVSRVLMLGGRLECIDDEIFFPYGRNFSVPSTSLNHRESIPPQLDITIPSPSFNTFSIYDGQWENPGLGLPVEDVGASEFYDLYGVQEEQEIDDDTATIHGVSANSSSTDVSPSPDGFARNLSAAGYQGVNTQAWKRVYDTSKDLEALFEHMLVHKFGINMHANEFILDVLQEVFGHAREVMAMPILLAPTGFGQDETERGRQRNGTRRMAVAAQGDFYANDRNRTVSASRRHSVAFPESRGLILWPSTIIPMSQADVEIHASKHLRMLLSCKNYLIEHAIEATDDEDIDEESVLEALWEYEGFLRHRFDLPSLVSASSSENNHQRSDSMSDRASIAESVTEAMLEIQSEFREHFGWHRASSEDRGRSPGTSQRQGLPEQDEAALDPDFALPLSPADSTPSRSPSRRGRPAARVVPGDELTHVRTFRVYEAIKVDEGLFGTTATP
ncbi:hypothetical protein D9613_006595 [Agrocybe pediades]|uniref:Methyltransferase domain-containing protein n=1 Tax=Agrocybe pediades TaxID=84607 RepID=A0A8H4QHX8_9AGAR|nr:hypothetical protein D9613_006595 [Agrocybe pediades]